MHCCINVSWQCIYIPVQKQPFQWSYLGFDFLNTCHKNTIGYFSCPLFCKGVQSIMYSLHPCFQIRHTWFYCIFQLCKWSFYRLFFWFATTKEIWVNIMLKVIINTILTHQAININNFNILSLNANILLMQKKISQTQIQSCTSEMEISFSLSYLAILWDFLTQIF